MAVQDVKGNLHDTRGRFTRKPLTQGQDLDSPFNIDAPDTPQQDTFQVLLAETKTLLKQVETQQDRELLTQARRAVQHVGAQVIALAEQHHTPGDGMGLCVSLQDELRKIRPMGCTVNITNIDSKSGIVQDAIADIRRACRYYPADWQSEHPVLVKRTRGRHGNNQITVGYYRHRHVSVKPTRYTNRNRVFVGMGGVQAYVKRFAKSPYIDVVDVINDRTVETREFEIHHPRWGENTREETQPKTGTGWEWWQTPGSTDPDDGYWRRPKRRGADERRTETGIMNVTGHGDTVGIAAHELAHLWEHEKNMVWWLERDYYEHRYEQAGCPEPSPGHKRGVTVNRDVFPSVEYMSTTYPGGKNFEIFSTGVESVFCGANNHLYSDPQTQNLIVGMLATVE